jgi:hypothetical protein
VLTGITSPAAERLHAALHIAVLAMVTAAVVRPTASAWAAATARSTSTTASVPGARGPSFRNEKAFLPVCGQHDQPGIDPVSLLRDDAAMRHVAGDPAVKRPKRPGRPGLRRYVSDRAETRKRSPNVTLFTRSTDTRCAHQGFHVADRDATFICMLRGRVGGLGLLTLVAVSGCAFAGDPAREAGATAQVPGYEAPAGAPAFCTGLAAATHVGGIPTAVGMLTVDRGDTAAVQQLEAAIGDLEEVLDDVSGDDRNARVTAALEDVLASVHSATRNPLDDGLLDRLTFRLEALGDEVQPLCEFPT